MNFNYSMLTVALSKIIMKKYCNLMKNVDMVLDSCLLLLRCFLGHLLQYSRVSFFHCLTHLKKIWKERFFEHNSFVHLNISFCTWPLISWSTWGLLISPLALVSPLLENPNTFNLFNLNTWYNSLSYQS